MALKETDVATLSQVASEVLAPFNKARQPGMTIGVVQQNVLVVHQSAGYADVEGGVALGPITRFRIASVSKQFTCALILIMAAGGKLSIEDDVRRWLPELPKFEYQITLDHLMRNISGIRDMLELMRLGGIDLDSSCTREDLMAAICRQNRLNFPPGTRYLYSNSGFMLLGKVAEAAGGAPFGDLLERCIFVPLGMTATRHTLCTAEPIRDLATGYLPLVSGGWRRAEHRFPLGGEGGLVSSVADLARWHGWLCSPAGRAVARSLSTVIPFEHGGVNSYGRGVGLSEYRGLALVEHGGLWPGYRSALIRVPARHLGFIAMTNNVAVDPQRVLHRLLDTIVEGGSPADPVSKDEGAVRSRTSRWVSHVGDATMDLAFDGAAPRWAWRHGLETNLRPLPDGRMGIPGGTTPLALRCGIDGLIEVEEDAGVVATYREAPPIASLPDGLSGRYANPDIAALWDFSGAAVEVAGFLGARASFLLEPVEGDLFRVVIPTYRQPVWLDVRALRNDRGVIAALEVNGARVRNLVFDRIEG